VGHIVHQLSQSRVDQVWVVTGHDREAMHRALDGQPVSFVHNRDYAQGMLSSVRCGIGALAETCEACLVALGDQPSLTSTLIDDLIQAFGTTPKGLLVPCYQGRRGHPFLISCDYFEEVLHRFDEVGLRGLMQAHPDDLCEYPVSSDRILSDMDYPGDYLREINRC
jgi:molybdenum cofactor cytidylyltransferase